MKKQPVGICSIHIEQPVWKKNAASKSLSAASLIQRNNICRYLSTLTRVIAKLNHTNRKELTWDALILEWAGFPFSYSIICEGKTKTLPMTLRKGTGKERGDKKKESDVGRRWRDERILERAPHLRWDMKNIKRWEKSGSWRGQNERVQLRRKEGVENNRACPLRRSVNLNATACLGLCRPSYTHASRVWKSSTSPYAPSFSAAFVHETEREEPRVDENAHMTCLQRAAVSAWEENFQPSYSFSTWHPLHELMDGFF